MRHTLPVMLRGGPNDGCQIDAEVDLETRTIDSIDHTGSIYRDSGLFFHGRRIFDWTPCCSGSVHLVTGGRELARKARSVPHLILSKGDSEVASHLPAS